MFSGDDTNGDDGNASESSIKPTIAGVAERLAWRWEGAWQKHYITNEMVCCTFLFELLNEVLDPTSSACRWLGMAISLKNNSELIDNLKEQLLACGGMDHMLLFLTGPAGASKTNAIMAADMYCFEFSSSHNIMWTDTLFLIQLTQDQLHQDLEDELLGRHPVCSQPPSLKFNDWNGVEFVVLWSIKFHSWLKTNSW